MIRPTIIVVGVAAAIVALTLTLTAPASTPRATPQTYQGRTAQAWHRIAAVRLRERDTARSKAGTAIRESRRLKKILLAFHKRFHAAPNRPPHYNEWVCIHNGEGAWNANTGNGFYGGLQFMQGTWERNGGLKYASRADLADPLEQMWVAESAWRESGGSFSQWPNTARRCGLL